MTKEDYGANKIKAHFFLQYHGENTKFIENILEFYMLEKNDESQICAYEEYGFRSMALSPTYSIQVREDLASSATPEDLKSIISTSIDKYVKTTNLDESNSVIYKNILDEIEILKVHTQNSME